MRSITLLFALLLTTPMLASAHGGQPSFEAEQGTYLVDIGYDVTGFRPDEEVTFDFDLYEDPNGTPSFAPFELIRVEISRDGEIVHAQELENRESFIPTMRYTFPSEGDYRLEAAYVQSGSVIADASFDVPVAANSGAAGRTINALTYVIAAALTAFAAWVAITSFLRSRAKSV